MRNRKPVRTLAGLMGIALGLSSLSANPAWEKQIEACLLEASQKGHDIANPQIADTISQAFIANKPAQARKYCPKTAGK
ncbi:MAG: hypothetical protein KDK39_10850 [Leptospiraceae bacterium]|nr:hypothetical protein [Leptospiraceae bacterium]